MQLMTSDGDSPRMLRLASQFLLDAALIAEAELQSGAPLMPATRAPTVDEMVGDARGVMADMREALAEAPALDPRVVFAQADTASAARIAAGGLGQGPTSFEAMQPVIPPPPPMPVAPDAGTTVTTGANTVTSVSSGVTVDRDGLPHDRRIHSETPTIKADGRWRARRNLDNATLVAVEAELRAGLPAIPAQVIPPPPPPVVVPAGTVAPPPPAPVIPPPPPAALPATETTIAPFRKLMAFVGPYTGVGGPLEASKMKAVHAEFGATGWQDYVAKCEPQIPALMERLKGMVS